MVQAEQTTRVLIVDDNASIRREVAEVLLASGFEYCQAGSAAEMYEYLKTESAVGLVILDIDMPVEDGYSACAKLRQSHPRLPIMMLSSFTGEYNKVASLELGADDYLTKPFGGAELVARIKALLRRTHMSATETTSTPVKFQFAGLTFDPKARCLSKGDGELIKLSDNEIELINIFVQFPGDVLSREKLIELSRNQSALPFDRRIDIIIHRLRKKLQTSSNLSDVIKTIRNKGYIFVAEITTVQ